MVDKSIPRRNALFHCKVLDSLRWYGTERKVIPTKLQSIRDLVVLEGFQRRSREFIGVYFLVDDVIIGKPKNFDPSNLKTLKDFKDLSEIVESWYKGLPVEMVLPDQEELNELP